MQANVTHGIPTQKPSKIPLSVPRYIDPYAALKNGGKTKIAAIIIYRYIHGGFFKLYFHIYWSEILMWQTNNLNNYFRSLFGPIKKSK